MKLIAFIENSFLDNKVKVWIIFYKKNKENKYDINYKSGDMQFSCTLPDLNWNDLAKSVRVPSSESTFAETVFASKIRSSLQPFIYEAIASFDAQEKFDFLIELINKKLSNKASCYIERNWLRSGGQPIFSDLKKFKCGFKEDKYHKEYVAINSECIFLEKEIRDLLLKEAMGFSGDFYNLKKLIPLIAPVSKCEILELLSSAPVLEDINTSADFIFSFIESKYVDLCNAEFIDLKIYTEKQIDACFKKILDPSICSNDIELNFLKKYYSLVSVKNEKNVSEIIRYSPLAKDIIPASRFLNLVININGFDVLSHNWNILAPYIVEFRRACLRKLATTESYAEYKTIESFFTNDILFILPDSSGKSDFLKITLDRLDRNDFGILSIEAVNYLLSFAFQEFPYNLSFEVIDRLVKSYVSNPIIFEGLEVGQQKLIFNIFSASECEKIFSEESVDFDKMKLYTKQRADEVLNAVKFNPEKGVKKALQMLNSKEYRVISEILRKLLISTKYCLDNYLVSEVYFEVLISQKPSPDWISLCEKLPILYSKLFVRSGLARYFVRNKNLTRAKLHVDAIFNFEPDSKIAIDLQSTLAREASLEKLEAEGLSFDSINNMTGVDFERILINKLEKIGFLVQSTPGSGDYGADIVLDDKEGTRFIIQCKRFGTKVNLRAVQEIVGAMKHYCADFAIVATNNEYLKSAVELAKSNDVELWDGNKVISVLSGDIRSTILSTAKIAD